MDLEKIKKQIGDKEKSLSIIKNDIEAKEA